VVISRFATAVSGRNAHRIEDHDGEPAPKAAIERCSADRGTGLDSAYVESTEGILPATRFAVEAYVHFCRDKSPLEHQRMQNRSRPAGCWHAA